MVQLTSITAYMPPPPAADPFRPVLHRIVSSKQETADTFTLVMDPTDEALPAPRPGQFNMLWAWGAGEVPISVSVTGEGKRLVHTIRDVGGVTSVLCAAAPGDLLGARGPFGTAWPIDAAVGMDLVIIAGGIGLAPLRPVVHAAIQNIGRFRSAALVVGARSVNELLYRSELDAWWKESPVMVRTTVDRPSEDWNGNVGTVVHEMPRLTFDPAQTVAMLCGPEIMIRFAARHLEERGVPSSRIWVSLERNMHCGARRCGHCQLGPAFVCSDGPVMTWETAESLLGVPEL